MAKYIKSHSNYTYKKRHRNTNGGTIFERDYMTITGLTFPTGDQIPIRSEGNFKFTQRNVSNLRKKHRYGTWLPNGNDAQPCATESKYWTSNCQKDTEISSETKIVLKPNYTSILDFSYLGSAVELVEASIKDIILKFPAEIYASGSTITSNPFQVDIFSTILPQNKMYPDIRYFVLSADRYEVFFGDSDTPVGIKTWTATHVEKECYSDKDILDKATITTEDDKVLEFNQILLNGQKVTKYLGSDEIHLRPKKEYMDFFYNGYEVEEDDSEYEAFLKRKLDDFQLILMNRETNPKYRARFVTIEEKDTGNISYYEDYIWPTGKGGYNLEIENGDFRGYLSSLTRAATYYDEYYSDNLWRSMTHESIKNLDWTHRRNNVEVDVNSQKLEKVMRIWARQLDDLKRYTDNIKVTNSVTYDEKGNTPDYFLTDKLNVAGWEVKDTRPTTDNTVKIENLYPGLSEESGYNSVSANEEVMRRLFINSRYIFSTKGTKQSLETIFSIFGLEKDKYALKEFVGVASEGFNYGEKIKLYNKKKKGYKDISSESDEEADEFQGLPVREITVHTTTGDAKYVIPWFDNLETYDGDIYFQMRGGWLKRDYKEVTLPSELTSLKELAGDNIYEETEKYINIVDTIDSLKNIPGGKLSSDDIYYVVDISNYGEYNLDPTDLSNYFSIKNPESSFKVKDDGWFNIPKSDLKNGLTPTAMRVLEAESIVDNNKGNNPHTGGGKYDMGASYIEHLEQLFKYSLDQKMFVDVTEAELEEIKKIGFKLTTEEDDDKTWFFKPENWGDRLKPMTPGYTEMLQNPSYDIYNPLNGTKDTGYTEQSSESVVVNKALLIEVDLEEEYFNYFMNTIMFYGMQVIPSTTIVYIVNKTHKILESITVNSFSYAPDPIPASGGTATPSYSYTMHYSDGSTGSTGGFPKFVKKNGEASLDGNTGEIVWDNYTETTSNRTTEVELVVKASAISSNAISATTTQEKVS